MSETTAIWLIIIAVLVFAGYAVFFISAIFWKPPKDYQQSMYFRSMSDAEWERLKELVKDEDQ